MSPYSSAASSLRRCLGRSIKLIIESPLVGNRESCLVLRLRSVLNIDTCSIGVRDTFAERHAMIAQYMANQDSNREHQARFWSQYGDFVTLMKENFPEDGTLDDYEHITSLCETFDARLAAISREEPHILMRKVTLEEWTLLLKQCNKRRDQQVQSALEGRVYTGTLASAHAMAFHCLFGDRCAISGQPIDMKELTCDA